MHYFDADGDPTDDGAECTRALITVGGRVITELNYLDAEGNPTPKADAWQVCHTDYDADGSVTAHSPGIITVDGGFIPRQR
jgi:hypothetical protein